MNQLDLNQNVGVELIRTQRSNQDQDQQQEQEQHICLTPGTVYNISIHESKVMVEAKLPFELVLNMDEIENLETRLHGYMEVALGYLFRR